MDALPTAREYQLELVAMDHLSFIHRVQPHRGLTMAALMIEDSVGGMTFSLRAVSTLDSRERTVLDHTSTFFS